MMKLLLQKKRIGHLKPEKKKEMKKPIHYATGMVGIRTKTGFKRTALCGVHIPESETERYTDAVEKGTCKGCKRRWREIKEQMQIRTPDLSPNPSPKERGIRVEE